MIRLREIRIKKGLTQKQLADKMYIYVGEWGTEPQHCNAQKAGRDFPLLN